MLRKIFSFVLLAGVCLGTSRTATAGVVIIDGQVSKGLEIEGEGTTPVPVDGPDLSGMSPEEQAVYLFASMVLHGHDAALAEAGVDPGDSATYGESSGTAVLYVDDDSQGCSAMPVGELGAIVSALLLWSLRKRR